MCPDDPPVTTPPNNTPTPKDPPVTDPPVTDPPVPPVTQSVDLKDRTRALTDLKSVKAKNTLLEQQIKDQELAKLKDSDNWKQIAENAQTESADWKQKYDSMGATVARDKKLSAVREHCMALGIKPEAKVDLDILDLDGVEIETTNLGNINVIGAKAFADKLKMSKPHWFGRSVNNVNTDLPLEITNNSKVTYEQLKVLEVKARKSGDYTAYEAATERYRSQLTQ